MKMRATFRRCSASSSGSPLWLRSPFGLQASTGCSSIMTPLLAARRGTGLPDPRTLLRLSSTTAGVGRGGGGSEGAGGGAPPAGVRRSYHTSGAALEARVDHGRPVPPVAVPREEQLRRNRANGSLHFVFIEGEAATGKSTICEMLKKQGYTVQFEGFVELCKENSRYSPQGSVVSIKWVSFMFTAMERFLHQFDEGQREFKDRVVFFDRSFLTPYVYTRGTLNNLYVCDAMKEIKAVFPCTTVLCKADVNTIENRLLQRYQQGDAKAKDIRKSLGELDHAYIEKVHNKYAELEQDGWFDYVLDSTAPSPQVVENLLQMLRRASVIRTDVDSSLHSSNQ